MSHIQGTDYVGSMVVMEDGLPKKSDYRRFKIKGVPGNDDFAAMEEVLTRRLTAYLAERRQPGRPSGRASSPTRRSCCSSTAARASSAWPCGCSRSSGLADEIPVAALAKRFEEVYVPGRGRPDPPPAPVRGAVPAAAHPRRGPPLRHHLPPRAAGQAHDHVASSTASPGSGRAAQEAAGEGARRRRRRSRRRRSRTLQALPWLPDAVAEAVLREDPRPVEPRPTPTTTSGRRHAGWWQDGFTDGRRPRVRGADPARWPPSTWPGRRRVLDVGTRRGPGRPAGRRRVGAEPVVGVDPTRAQVAWRRGAGRRPALRPGRRRRRCRSPTARFDAVVACLVFEHIDDVDAAIAEVARVLAARRPVPVLPQPPAAADARAAAGSTTRSSTRPSSTGGSAPTWSRTSRSRRWRRASFIPFIHRPLSRYVNALADDGLLARRAWRSRRRRRASSPGRRVRSDAATIPRLLLLVPRSALTSRWYRRRHR